MHTTRGNLSQGVSGAKVAHVTLCSKYSKYYYEVFLKCRDFCGRSVMVCNLNISTYLSVTIETTVHDFCSVFNYASCTFMCACLQQYSKAYLGHQKLCWTAPQLPAGHRYQKHHCWLRLTVFCCHSLNGIFYLKNFSFFWSAIHILQEFSNL